VHRPQRVACVFLVSLCALFCLAPTGGAVPQLSDDSARIVGHVRDAASGEPIAAARVELLGPNGMAAPTRYTDTSGAFFFGARDGDYHLVIRKVGYKDSQVNVSIVAAAQSRVDVDLVRETSDSESTPVPVFPPTISAHQLKVPEKAREDFRQGQALAAQHDYTGAVEQFQKALQVFPSYYEAYAEMGLAQYMLGQAAAARESLQKSVDLSEGKYPDALFDYAEVLNALHEFAQAEPLARQGMVLEESSSRGPFELARALLGLKRFAEAEQSAKQAQKLNTQDPQIYVVLVSIHAGMRHYAALVQDVDAYLKLDPNSPMSDRMRATRAQAAKALADAEARSAPKPQ
jgi:Carboxypeptidase regulatory-like domain/TPR repeat/Tetratricopeptide repeat